VFHAYDLIYVNEKNKIIEFIFAPIPRFSLIHSKINPGHLLMSYLKGLLGSLPKLASNDSSSHIAAVGYSQLPGWVILIGLPAKLVAF
jgi:hypothetical protein